MVLKWPLMVNQPKHVAMATQLDGQTGRSGELVVVRFPRVILERLLKISMLDMTHVI